jgi:hypothetical protein
MDKLLGEIVIPKFITKILLSAKRRPKYYTKKDKIPKKYQDCIFKKGYLVNVNGAKIVKNIRSVGTPKYEQLSGNSLLSGYASPYTRAKIARELKAFYKPFVKEFVKKNGAFTEFPIRVTWDVYTDISSTNWDASNLFFYYKYFEDTLFLEDTKVIPDDCIKYITFSPGAKIIPVDNWEKRKFVFKFYYDDRTELKREPWIS